MAVRYEEPHPGPRRNPILSFVREHFTVVGSGIAALIFAIRLLFGVWPLLRGDIYIYAASILLAQTSLGDAIRALLFFVLPAALYTLTIGLAIATGMSMPLPRSLRAFSWRSLWRSLAEWSGRKPLRLLAASLAASVGSSYLSGHFTAYGPWYIVYEVTFPIIPFVVLVSCIRDYAS